MAGVKAVARHLGVSPRRVQQLVEEGTIEKQPPGAYDLSVCREKYLERLRSRRPGGNIPRNPTLAAIKRERGEVDLEAAQLQLAVARGEVVPISAVAAAIERGFSALRQHLVSIGSRTGDTLLVCTREQAQALLDGEIEQGLQELRETLLEVDWSRAQITTTAPKLGRPSKIAAMLRDQAKVEDGGADGDRPQAKPKRRARAKA